MASVKWSELYRWSLVEVEFGTPKKCVTDDFDCVDIAKNYIHEINTNNEFSYRHMAIVLSKNIRNSTITVVPLTEFKIGDEKNNFRVVLKAREYKNFLYKDTTILVDNIITIEKKIRIKKIVLSWLPVPIRRKIQKAMISNFK